MDAHWVQPFIPFNHSLIGNSALARKLSQRRLRNSDKDMAKKNKEKNQRDVRASNKSEQQHAGSNHHANQPQRHGSYLTKETARFGLPAQKPTTVRTTSSKKDNVNTREGLQVE